MSDLNRLSRLFEPPKEEVTPPADTFFGVDLGTVVDTGWSVIVPGTVYGSLTYHVASTEPVYRPLSDDDFTQLMQGLQEQSAVVLQTVGGLADSTAAMAAIVERLESLIAAVEVQSRQLTLSSLGSEKYRLRSPLPVELSRQDETIVAHSPDLEVYGSAESEYDALDDLRLTIVEEFEFLEENESHLDKIPTQQILRFRDLIETL